MEESILLSSRDVPMKPEAWQDLPIHFKARPIFPEDVRVLGQAIKLASNSSVYSITSQFGILTNRSQSSRDIGRIKDSAVPHRKQYVGDSAILQSLQATKNLRGELYNARLNNNVD
jgi:hypothetical protein